MIMNFTNDQNGLFTSWVSIILYSYKIIVSRLQRVFVPTLTENHNLFRCRV